MVDSMEAVEYRESWRVLLVLKLWPLGIVAMGITTAIASWPVPLGIAVGALVTAFGFYLLVSCFSPPEGHRSCLRLDAEGVHEVGPLGLKRLDLPWAAITGARVEPYRKVWLVVLDVDDADHASASAAWMRNETSVRVRVALGSPFVLAPRLYGLTPEHLCGEIMRWLDAYGSRRLY